MADAGIIRARAKIEATIRGAQIYCEMEERGERLRRLLLVIHRRQGAEGRRPQPDRHDSPLSEQISKEMKRRGFKFVGPTIVYAWMQAVGIVNDHSDRLLPAIPGLTGSDFRIFRLRFNRCPR